MRERRTAEARIVDRTNMREMRHDGWTIVRNLVPSASLEIAQAEIARTLHEDGRAAVSHDTFLGHDHCPPLRHSPAILQLLYDTPVFHVAETFARPDGFDDEHCSQTTMRFQSTEPDKFGAHVDGASWGSPDAPAPYTLLISVLLSSHQAPDCGALKVWSGSHQHMIAAALKARAKTGALPTGGDLAAVAETFNGSDASTLILGEPGDVFFGVWPLVHTPTMVRTPEPRSAVYFRLQRTGQSFERSVNHPWADLDGVRRATSWPGRYMWRNRN